MPKELLVPLKLSSMSKYRARSNLCYGTFICFVSGQTIFPCSALHSFFRSFDVFLHNHRRKMFMGETGIYPFAIDQTSDPLISSPQGYRLT